MGFYITWETSSKIPLQEKLGPFPLWEAAEREVAFMLTDPYVKVHNIDIEVEEESANG